MLHFVISSNIKYWLLHLNHCILIRFGYLIGNSSVSTKTAYVKVRYTLSQVN